MWIVSVCERETPTLKKSSGISKRRANSTVTLFCRVHHSHFPSPWCIISVNIALSVYKKGKCFSFRGSSGRGIPATFFSAFEAKILWNKIAFRGLICFIAGEIDIYRWYSHKVLSLFFLLPLYNLNHKYL